MIGPLAYYLSRSLINRVRCRIQRLRQPKYLIALVGGLAYVYFAFLRGMRSSPASSGNELVADPGLIPLLETGGAVLLFASVLMAWIWPSRAGAIRFAESEIQMLFPAPLARRTLLNFKIVAAQPGIFLGVLVSILILGRSAHLGHPVFLAMTLWLVYSFLALSRMGTWLAKASLAEHGLAGLRRHAPAAALLSAVAVLLVIWWQWFVPPLPPVERLDIGALSEWILRLFDSGPAYYLLLPFRLLVRPVFSPDALTFALRLLPALGLLAVVYFWVMRSDAAFEEAALERARKLADRAAAQSGDRRVYRRGSADSIRRPLFRLGSSGPPFMAIFWKNLIAIGRLDIRLWAPLVIVAAILIAVASQGRSGEEGALPAVIGGTAAGIALFMTLFGPVIVRDDLRNDLLQVHQLKTYPIPGWSVVLGEALAPVTILACVQWALLLVAAVAIPEPRWMALDPARRAAVALACAILFPCLAAVGVVIQNAAALLMPSWVQLGRDHARGIEAMGQRLLTMAAAVLLLAFAAIPAGIVFGAAYFLSAWLLGEAALPLAAAGAAVLLLAEAGLGIIWLGRLWDRFDASRELDAVP